MRFLLGCLAMANATASIAHPLDPAAGTDQPARSYEVSIPPAVNSQAKSHDWHFAAIGYFWAANAKGAADVIGPVPPADLDISFGTILKHLKFVVLGAAEARKNRVIFLGDLMWGHLGASEGISIRDPRFSHADLDNKTLAATVLGGYRVINEGPVIVDVLAGGRLNRTATALDLTGTGVSASGEVRETWIDPVIATRTFVPLGGRMSMTVYGDIGGVVWGSDLSWQAIATVNYQLSRKVRLGAGWRYFKINYDKGDFLYDIAQSGPVVSLRTDF